MLKTEKIQDVFAEAIDGRTFKDIHDRLTRAGVEVDYQTTRRWMQGRTLVPLRYLAIVFDTLSLTPSQRTRAIKAASQ